MFASYFIFINKLKRQLYLIILLFFPCFLWGQLPYFQHLTTQHGLPGNSIYDIYQDSKGYIWIAGDFGIARYDGFQFRVYNQHKQKSRSGSTIQEDADGKIWYCTFDGVLYYVQKDSLYEFRQPHRNYLFKYKIVGTKLFVGFQQGQEDGTELWDTRSMTLEKKLPFWMYFVSKQGEFLIAHTSHSLFSGIYRVSLSGEYSRLNLPPNCLEFKQELITASDEKGFWVMSKLPKEQGVIFIESSSNPHVTQFETAECIRQALDLLGDTLWLSSSNGLYLYDRKGNLLNKESWFPDFSFSKVLRDREGNFWIGTTNAGLLFVPDINSQQYSYPNESPCQLQATDSSLYIGTKIGTLLRVSDFKKQAIEIFREKQKHPTQYLFADPAYQSLYVIDIGLKKINTSSNNVLVKGSYTPHFKSICRLDHKYLAIATSGGIFFMAPERNSEASVWDNWNSPKTLADSFSDKARVFEKTSSSTNLSLIVLGPARCKEIVKIDGEDRVYFVSSQGFYCLTPEKILEIKHKGERILASQVKNYQKRIFVKNNQNELLELLPDNSFKIWNTQKKEIDKIKICSHFLFLFCGKQLFCTDLNDSQAPINEIKLPFSALEINDFCFFQEKICLATNANLIVFPFQLKNKGKEIPLFLFQDFRIKEKSYFYSSQKSFSYLENEIEVYYTILSFRTGNQYPLYYRINQGHWALANPNHRSLRLLGLSPGNYTLDFRLGEEGEFPVHNLSFEIRPPFWAHKVFVFFVVFSLLAAAIGFYLWRTSLLKKQNELLLDKIRLEKDLRNSMLVSIKSQMNPHFLFNSLNTIQSFIFADDKRKAASYLGKFSRLTRKILEMSEKETVLLSEEIESLNLYLSLEKIRFNEGMSYEFRLDSQINADEVRIPSMIIQPYVENAIKHGLLHKNGEKILKIEIKIENQMLKILIEDNGIGRVKSAEINLNRKFKHESFSTGANMKRIEILKEDRENMGVEYIDKVDENSLSLGTIVIIIIPLTYNA